MPPPAWLPSVPRLSDLLGVSSQCSMLWEPFSQPGRHELLQSPKAELVVPRDGHPGVASLTQHRHGLKDSPASRSSSSRRHPMLNLSCLADDMGTVMALPLESSKGLCQ